MTQSAAQEVGFDPAQVQEGDIGLLARIKSSFFMLLYLISKDQNTPSWVVHFNQVVGVLQLTHAALASSRFHWHHSLKSLTVPLLGWLSLDSIMEIDLVPYGVLLSAALVVLVFLVSAHICFSFMITESVDHLWTLPILQVTLRLMTSVLFIPIVNMLMAVFQARPSKLSEYLPPGSAAATWAIIGATVLIIVFVAFNALTAACFVDNNPFSLHSARQVHGRVEAASLVLRAVVTAAFSLDLLFDTWVTVSALLASSLLLTGLHVVYMPYYSQHLNRLFAVSYGFFLWACVCLAIAQMIGSDDDYGSLTALVAGCIPFMCTISCLVDRRAESLAKMHPTAFTSPYIAELILRFKFFGCENGLGAAGTQPEERASLEHKWFKVESDYRDVVENMFRSSVFMNLHFAALVRALGSNELLSAQVMQRAKGLRGAKIDHEFMFFKHIQRNREQEHGTDAGALSYVAFTHHRNQAENKIEEAIGAIHALWALVYKKNAHSKDDFTSNSSALLAASSKVYAYTTQAKLHLEALVARSHGSKHAMLLYAVYAEDVLGDDITAAKIRHSVGSASSSSGSSGGGEGKSAGSEDLIALTISGAEKDFGALVATSDEFGAVFGINRAEAIGRDAAQLFPRPVDDMFTNFLQDYMRTNRNFVTANRIAWIKRGGKDPMTQCKASLSVMQTESGQINFSCRLTAALDQPCFCIVDLQGCIVAYGKKVMQEFGLRVGSRNSRTSIYAFIPALSQALPAEKLAALNQVLSLDLAVDGAGEEDKYGITAWPFDELPRLDSDFMDDDEALINNASFKRVGGEAADTTTRPKLYNSATRMSSLQRLLDDREDGGNNESKLLLDVQDDEGKKAKEHFVYLEFRPLKEPSRLDLERHQTNSGTLPLSPGGRSRISSTAQFRPSLTGASFGGNYAQQQQTDGRSHAGDRSEATSQTTQTNRQQQKVLVIQNKINEEEKRLVRFRKVSICVWFFFVGFSLASFFWDESQVQIFLDNIELMQRGAHRAFYLNDVVAQLQELQYMADKNISNKPLEIEIAQDMAKASLGLRDAHEIFLRDLHEQGGSTALEELLFAPDRLAQTDDGEKFETISFDRAILKIATIGHHLAQEVNVSIAQNEHLDCHSECEFLLNNVPFELLAHAFDSVTLVEYIAEDVLDERITIATGVSIVSLVLVFLFTLTFMLPVIDEAESTKMVLVEALGHIPRSTVRKLRKNAKYRKQVIRTKMERIRNPNAMANDEQADFLDDEFEEPPPRIGSFAAAERNQQAAGVVRVQ